MAIGRAVQTVVGLALPVLAILVAGIAVWGVVPRDQPQVRLDRTPRFMENWEDALPSGRRVGPPDARVRIVVFSDLQCKYCGQFHRALRAAMQQHPGNVAYTFIHFPLRANHESVAAARLVECAAAEDHAIGMLDLIFAHQDSLPTRDWLWFARAVGLRERDKFMSCLASPEVPELVTRGLAMGAWMSVRGTPVVILNGWRFSGAPDDTAFARAVSDIVGGRTPYE